MADVFISYAKKDRQYAEELASFLDELSLTTWWDANLVGGQGFREKITDEIDQSKVTIVIWSPNSIKSDFVIDEADHARQSGKLLSGTVPGFNAGKIPIGFRSAQVVSIGEGDQLIQALIAAGVGDLRRTGGYLLGIFARQVKAIERNTQRTQRLAVAAFSIAAVAAAAFAATYWLLQPTISAYPSTSINTVPSEGRLDINSAISLYFGKPGNVSDIARFFATNYTVQALSVALYDKAFQQISSKSDKKSMRLIIGSLVRPTFETDFSAPREPGAEFFVVTCASLSKGSSDAISIRLGNVEHYRYSIGPSDYSSLPKIDVGEDQIERLQRDSGCRLGNPAVVSP